MRKFVWAFILISCHINARIPQKVIICGVCKDVASRLPYTITIMEKIGSLFRDYRVVVYENNSSDTTPNILKAWQKSNGRVYAISEFLKRPVLERIIVNRLDNGDLFCPEAIARARNIVLEVALSDSYDGFDYIIWMDMDFKLEPDYEAFEEIFTTNKKWDAVFAYGIDPRGVHWDWYAFRDELCPIGSELLGNDWWYLPKQLVLTKNNDWYHVYSAFGGCGIYKKASIKGCRYSALVTQDLAQFAHNIITNNPLHSIVKKYLKGLEGIKKHIAIDEPSYKLSDIRDELVAITTDGIPPNIMWRMSSFVYKYPSVCEHVTFHASMIVRGNDKLFINPRLIFRYGG